MREFASSRFRWLLLALLCIPMGLATRPLKHHYDILGSALGDAVWALLVFALVCAALPSWPLLRRVLVALALACLVELSQLWHVPWLDVIRHTTLGGLAIGGSFSVGDLICYTVGIGVGALLTRRVES